MMFIFSVTVGFLLAVDFIELHHCCFLKYFLNFGIILNIILPNFLFNDREDEDHNFPVFNNPEIPSKYSWLASWKLSHDVL